MIKLSSGKEEPTDWLWKTVFRTNTVKFDAGLTKETVFQQLDHALAEVLEKAEESAAEVDAERPCGMKRDQ